MDGAENEPPTPEIDRTFSRKIRQMHRRGEHAAVIAALRGKLDAGEARPWMFEVLALSLKLTGADDAAVADAVLGGFDAAAAGPPALLAAAGYLKELGLSDRAVQLCRRAAELAQDAAEPYRVALAVLGDPADRPADAAWAAAGVLRTSWGPRYAADRERAEGVAAAALDALRTAGDPAELAAAEAVLADAAAADLVVKVTWSGDADVDLTVTEPGGTVTNTLSRRSAGGGILVRDGFGPDRKNAVEEYRLPRGYDGVYLLNMGLTRGEPVGQRVRVELTRHAGSSAERTETFTVPLKAVNTPALVTLRGGRRTAPAAVTARVPPPPPKRLRLADLTDGSVADRQRLGGRLNQLGPGGGGGGIAPGAVGYRPEIALIREGTSLAASAVVSADRRFVRLSLAPSFANVTDIFNFSFQTQPGAGPGAAGGGAGGGIGGGGGGF